MFFDHGVVAEHRVSRLNKLSVVCWFNHMNGSTLVSIISAIDFLTILGPGLLTLCQFGEIFECVMSVSRWLVRRCGGLDEAKYSFASVAREILGASSSKLDHKDSGSQISLTHLCWKSCERGL